MIWLFYTMTWHFYELTILSIDYFIDWLFYTMTWHFYKLIVLSIDYFIDWLFYWLTILSIDYFIQWLGIFMDWLFYTMTWHFYFTFCTGLRRILWRRAFLAAKRASIHAQMTQKNWTTADQGVCSTTKWRKVRSPVWLDPVTLSTNR